MQPFLQWPFKITLSITQTCNLNCKHCYADCNERRAKDELTTREWLRFVDYLAANEGANPLVVLTKGFQSAFWACVVLAGIGAALALLLLGRPRRVPHEQLEAAPAQAGD